MAANPQTHIGNQLSEEQKQENKNKLIEYLLASKRKSQLESKELAKNPEFIARLNAFNLKNNIPHVFA
jgi:hypothetical protein